MIDWQMTMFMEDKYTFSSSILSGCDKFACYPACSPLITCMHDTVLLYYNSHKYMHGFGMGYDFISRRNLCEESGRTTQVRLPFHLNTPL